jgi:hypothetical protein
LKLRLKLKQNNKNGAGGMAEAVECLTTKCKVLSSKQKKKNRTKPNQSTQQQQNPKNDIAV